MKKTLYATLFTVLLPCASYAQSPDLPPLPTLPTGGAPLNPLNPMTGGGFPSIEPIAPLQTGTGQSNPSADLPNLSQDDFDFFQTGADVGKLPSLDNLPDIVADTPQPIIEKPAPRARNPHARPYQKRFNYRQQELPATIYKKAYDRDNRHLPVAQHEADYDRATFTAAAQNNVNGLRAMLDYGGRDIHMRNAAGETLLQTATRYRAHAAVRYLLAKGAPHGASHAQNGFKHYTLAAGTH